MQFSYKHDAGYEHNRMQLKKNGTKIQDMRAKTADIWICVINLI